MRTVLAYASFANTSTAILLQFNVKLIQLLTFYMNLWLENENSFLTHSKSF